MASMQAAAGVLAMLEEDSPKLLTHALKKLCDLVDLHWSEVSENIDRISELSEDETRPYSTLAALVAAKCYFHLEEYDDALEYALSAGTFFDVEEKSEFVQTLISRCIDNYTVARREGEEVDERLAAVVDRMFQRCFTDGEFKQALGVALEARRVDMIEAAITGAPDVPAMLSYCFRASLTLVDSRAFRSQVLRMLVRVFRAQAEPNYFDLVRALQFLDDAKAAADVLNMLLSADDTDSHLTAYQVGFDIVENQNQQFQRRVIACLPQREAPKKEPSADGEDEAAAPAAEDNPAADVDMTGAGAGDGAGAGADADADDDDDQENGAYWARLERMKDVLLGTVTVDLYVDFLSHHNHADLQILQNIKDAVPARDSMLHHAIVVCHGLMQCGTTIDTFLLNNLQWLRRAADWNRFSATAAQGVVHKGHDRESMKVLEPYLPKENVATDKPFLEGGALYALGLIHANRGTKEVLTYLENALGNTQHAVLQHGASLGIGLAAMGTADVKLFNKLKGVLVQEDANAGEGAGLGLGLLLAGAGPAWGATQGNGAGAGDGKTADRDSDDDDSDADGSDDDDEEETPVAGLLTYAAETQHEKTSRGIAMCLAMMCYGREEEAQDVIDRMAAHKDAVLRYGAMYAAGLAYAGTSNNAAVRLLLHVAVSDVSDDVRRAAVINLGFVLLNAPEKVPTLVALLAESYNPHVRYGACTAVAVACAGSGMAEAVELLEPMAKDKSDFVRQGALMGLAMVLQQETVEHCPAVKRVRELFTTVVSDKRTPPLVKMGAIVASGILDAGGRNCVISLRSRAGFRKMSAIIGMALFQQHWFWFPCIHMLSLSMTPTALIGLNHDLKLPKAFTLQCNTKRKLFDYPPMLKPKRAAKKKRVQTVELSITAQAKAKARAAAKKKAAAEAAATQNVDADGDAAMTGDDAGAADGDGDTKMASDDSEGNTENQDESKTTTADAGDESPFTISNPARVTNAQSSFIAFAPDGQRYVPIRQPLANRMGVVMLRDTTPDANDEDLVDIKPPPAQSEADEPEPPEPFEWIPN